MREVDQEDPLLPFERYPFGSFRREYVPKESDNMFAIQALRGTWEEECLLDWAGDWEF